MATANAQKNGYRLSGGARFLFGAGSGRRWCLLVALYAVLGLPAQAAGRSLHRDHVIASAHHHLPRHASRRAPSAQSRAHPSSAPKAKHAVLPPPNVGAADLQEIRALAQGGAPDLALRMMDRAQPSAKTDVKGWMQWERERVAIYAATQDWATMIKRLGALPSGLPSGFVRWARTQQARAYLAQHKAPEARAVLRQLIWTGHTPDKKWLAQWRHLIIRSYLEQGRGQDAYTALSHYQQDYGEGGLADRLLRARILLSLGRSAAAARLLSHDSKSPPSAMLYLLARLRSGEMAPRAALGAALHQVHDDGRDKPRAKRKAKAAKTRLPKMLTVQQWALVAEAARRAHDRETRAYALERAISASHGRALPDGLFAVNGDRLWDAYFKYAVQLGNQAKFLIGDDKRWFAAAEKAKRRTPVRARSLYALLILHGQSAHSRARAARDFVATLTPDPADDALLTALFLHSPGHFPHVKDVPLPLRYALVDIGLKHSDIALASRVMAAINRPPKGTNAFMWELRRARILVYGGKPDKGAAVLRTLLKAHAAPAAKAGHDASSDAANLSKEQIQHLLQVIFDLQTLGKNNTAIALFKLTLAQSRDTELSRQILYWMGDSRKAQHRYIEAARLYLKSAMYGHPKAMDPWAQTARYQAAGALAKAGLRKDARDLYQQLLSETKDPARRAVLTHDMQELWLVH